MKVVGLISGGKDSCYNLMQCIAAGHSIEALANLCPKDVDELDSYMYQSVGHRGLSLYAEALDLPLYQREIEGTSLNTQSIYYKPTKGDEVEDLFRLLKEVKEKHQIEAVSVGAVFSDYQRIRVENVCQRLNLICLAYMWRRDQSELLEEMIDCGIKAVLVKVAAIGLLPEKHLAKSIEEMQPYLYILNKKYDLNVCGEGGEYETFTLDCPLFKKRIVMEEYEVIETPGDVGYLKFKSLKLVEKQKDLTDSVMEKVSNKIKSKDHLGDILNLEGNSNIKIGLKFGSDESLTDDESDIRTTSCTTTGEEILISQTNFTRISSNGSSVKEALTYIANLLQKSNKSLKDIVSIEMFVKDMKEYIHLNKEYTQFFDINPPTRTCVQVPIKDDNIVMLNATIYSRTNSDLSIDPSPRRDTLHVQSMSHWAPANIGPYSQAVKIGDLIFVAGMIGMVPSTLQIVSGSVETQACLAYKHLGRILSVISPKSTVKSIVQGVCYVTIPENIENIKSLMEELHKFQICLYVVVPELPKGALVEWQTWAHIRNSEFIYEETKLERSNLKSHLKQRSSKDGSLCALVATASCDGDSVISKSDIEELLFHCIDQTNSSDGRNKEIHLNVYYSSVFSSSFISNSLSNVNSKSDVTIFAIPVLAIEDEKTLLAVVLIKI